MVGIRKKRINILEWRIKVISFKKYQWNDLKLQKKAKTYDYLMVLSGILVVACIYLLPDKYIMANLIFIVVGIIMWILSDRTKTKDKKLKLELEIRKRHGEKN